MTPTNPEEQRRLVEALALPVVETHISYVLLDGSYAYKVKKAIDLEFLDFRTLDKRRFYCEEELRLNRQLAPSIYLDVVSITGDPAAPVIAPLDSGRRAIEYAVRMRQFDQEGLLSRVIARDELTSDRVDEIASAVAAFHERTARAGRDIPYGRPEHVLKPVRQNFDQMLGVVTDRAERGALERLRAWTEEEANRCQAVFESRNLQGFVRECHGDLHLGNIALVDGAARTGRAVTLFDRIEFNPAMRWIDVMSDVAFLVMDLRDRKRPDLAARFLNTYLELTGDYAGLALLRFYVTYRALVRAKVACLQKLAGEYRTYLTLALSAIERPRPSLVITHGVTGSGKSTRAQAVVDSSGAIRIRSDVERKRLLGLDREARTASARGEGLYTTDVNHRTYGRLASLARLVVEAGYPVVVDAAFLERWQRDQLRAVARELEVPFAIADCSAPEPVLRERVRRRFEDGRDPSEATIEVLEYQLTHADPLAPDELALRH